MPATCDSTETVLNAWPVPIARNSTGNELRSTLLITTGTADFSAVLSRAPLPPDVCAAPLLSVQPARASREISEMGAAILRTLTISLSIRSRVNSSQVNDACVAKTPLTLDINGLQRATRRGHGMVPACYS